MKKIKFTAVLMGLFLAAAPILVAAQVEDDSTSYDYSDDGTSDQDDSTGTQNATTTDFSNFQGLQIPSEYLQSGNSNGQEGLQMPADSLQVRDVVLTPGPRLIKLEKDATVYWVSQNGIKIPMSTAKVFLSYNNKWSDVETVEQEIFDSYQIAKFIWLNGTGAIYKIKDGVKHYIPSSIWNPAGIPVEQIINVNKTDFNSYKSGSNVSEASELE